VREVDPYFTICTAGLQRPVSETIKCSDISGNRTGREGARDNNPLQISAYQNLYC